VLVARDGTDRAGRSAGVLCLQEARELSARLVGDHRLGFRRLEAALLRKGHRARSAVEHVLAVVERRTRDRDRVLKRCQPADRTRTQRVAFHDRGVEL
jgi:hypothetical protein